MAHTYTPYPLILHIIANFIYCDFLNGANVSLSIIAVTIFIISYHATTYCIE